MLCKHYETTKGCVYKDKCQFAHSSNELRSSMNVSIINPDDGSNDDEPNDARSYAKHEEGNKFDKF